MKSIHTIYLTGLLVVSLLTACGGGGSSTSSTNNADSGALQTAGGDIQISGAGIKGPLAFADTKIFSLDPSFREFYDNNSPISIAITDQYAQFSGLTVPADIEPPYILVIGGSQAIDLNTGRPPIISKLITVITQEMLDGSQPVYATPLTTLAVHMASKANDGDTNASNFVSRLKSASREISRLLSIDQNHAIDIFGSPLIINDTTDTLAKQEEAVYHRAALEAFAAKLHRLSSRYKIPTDILIRRVALDIESDGVIDNAANGTVIGGIDPETLKQDPMTLTIPNTTHQIEDTIALMEEERTAIGTGNGPEILVDTIDFNNPLSDGDSSGFAATDPLPTPEPVPVIEPLVTFSVDSIDFGIVNVGSVSDVFRLTVNNVGNGPFNISRITLRSDFTETNNCGNILMEDASCSFDISFVPTASGSEEGSLIIDGDSANAPYNISLTGSSILAVNLEPTTLPSVDPSEPAIEFHQDFNNLTADTVLSEQQIKDNFAPITSGVHNNASTGVTVVADPANSGRGNSLRVFFPEGEFTTRASGAAWQTRISPKDEYYFAYDIYVPVDFNWPLGSKVPGLFGGDLGAASGKVPVNGFDGFAVRQTIYSERQDGDTDGFGNIGNGVITATTYTVDGSTKNRKYSPALTDSWDGTTKLTTGRWVSVEQRVVLNDPSKSNGIYEAWVDGVKVFSENDWTYRLSSSLQIDHISFIWFYGGSTSDWGAREDQYMYFDNFVVSTQPITH